MIIIMAICNCVTWICSRCWCWFNKCCFRSMLLHCCLLMLVEWLRRLRLMLRWMLRRMLWLNIVQLSFFSIKWMRLLSVRLSPIRISMSPLSVLMTIWPLIIWRIIRWRSIWPMMGIINTINRITLVKTVIWITWLLPIQRRCSLVWYNKRVILNIYMVNIIWLT